MSDHYAPINRARRVCQEGEFVFSAIGLDHGHVFGMTDALINAGATLKYVYDPDPQKIGLFQLRFPDVRVASSYEEVLEDGETQLIAGACIPSERCGLGLRVLDCGKHYFTDKAPLTTLTQLDAAKAKVRETGKKYMVYYSERLHSESAEFAAQLIDGGAIGRVVQVMGLGPHRLHAQNRPEWFFQREKYGGILCDIGSHQIEQYLFYAGETDAEVVRSQIANYNNPAHPELDDFGDAMLTGANGTSNYFRVDWLTPAKVRAFGDGKTIILGTKGFLELRKYTNIGTDQGGDNVFLVNDEVEQHFRVAGQVGYPFFGDLILDCLNGTENAMTQAHAFKAAELCVKAQVQAVRLT